MVYFRPEQKERLDSVSRERNVAMAALVRSAVDRFLDQLTSGQLQLPLGL